MNYTQIYSNLCLRGMVSNRKKSNIHYYENHHYLPASLGGLKNKSNMVLLTAREHYIAHFLLYKIYKQNGMKTEMHKMVKAWNMMGCNKTGKRHNSHTFAIARKLLSKTLSELQTGKKLNLTVEQIKAKADRMKGNKINKGMKHTKKTNKANSMRNKGENNAMYGKTHSAEAKQKIREKAIGRVWTEEAKEKVSITLKQLNKNMSEERKEQLKKSFSVDVPLECPYCDRLFTDKGNYSQHINKFCKEKK